MGERKKVDRKKKELEKKIEIFKKNNKALCDMLTLYSYFAVEDKELDPAVYVVLDEVIKDLEDKDVNVPFKAESIEKLFNQDIQCFYTVLRELKETEYYDELEGSLHESYRTIRTRMYYSNHYVISDNLKRIIDLPYNFLGNMCEYSPDFVSEILCSNIKMSKKVDILYNIVKHCLERENLCTLDHILKTKGAGAYLSRTTYKVKEQKISELITAFKTEMDRDSNKKEELLNIILRKIKNSNTRLEWLCFLQEQKLVDFMNTRRKSNIDGEEKEYSLCIYLLGMSYLKNFKDFYQLEDYRKLPENIRANDDKCILKILSVEDIVSFIGLSNYQTGIDDIKLIAERVFEFQESCDEVRTDIIEQIKSAIIHKSKDKEEYKTYCKLAGMFEQLADYKAYKKQKEAEEQERKRVKQQEERELLNARYEFILRLYNMKESLEEQVPGKKVIKELVFEKERQDDW